MLSPDARRELLSLLRGQPIGALGTLHKSEPFVSMVPFALLPAPARFVIHVSRLATHTKDMLACPSTSLMVVGSVGAVTSPREVPRATFQCTAAVCLDFESLYPVAKATYLTRFPDSEELFNFADFSLFTLEPRSLRYVGGFARANSITHPELGSILSSYSENAA